MAATSSSESLNPSDRSVWIIKPDGNIEGGVIVGAFPSALPKHRKDHLDKLIAAGVTDYMDLTTSLERKRFGEYKGYIQSTMAAKNGEGTVVPGFHESTIDSSIKDPKVLCHEVYKASLATWNLVRQNKIVYVFDQSFDGRAALVCLFAVFQDFSFEDDPLPVDGFVTQSNGEKMKVGPEYVPRKGVDKKRTVTANVTKRLEIVKLAKKNKLGLFTLTQTRAITFYDARNDSQIKWMQGEMAKNWAREKARQAKEGGSSGPSGPPSFPVPPSQETPSQETLDKINEIIASSSGTSEGSQEPIDLDRNESRQMLMDLLAQVKKLPVKQEEASTIPTIPLNVDGYAGPSSE